MKHHLTQTTTFIALLAAGALHAAAADFTVGGIQYSTLDESTVTVKKYVEGTDIAIPSTVNDGTADYTVVMVSANAFRSAAIKSLTLPPTVTTIDYYAFWKTSIETVTFAEGLESIGYGAFKECSKLTEVTLPSTLKELGAVWSLAGFGGAAFAECTSLAKINVPASVTELPQQTFAGCSSLSDVTLSEGLTTIGERVFEACTSLKDISLPASLTTVERAAFNKTGLENPVVPASIKIIPNSCYLWCSDMKSFTIEEGIVEIGKQSFADCGAFEEVVVPNSVEWIRSDAFQGNANVKNIKLGEGVRRLGHASLAVWAPLRQTNEPQWSLTDIHISSPVPPVHEQNDDHFDVVDDDFFFGAKEFTDELKDKFYSEVTLHVPADAIDTYRNAAIWGSFKNIVALTDGAGTIIATGPEVLSVCGGVVSGGNGSFKVYDTAGALVASATGTSFDLATLGAGVYVVKSGDATLKAAVR